MTGINTTKDTESTLQNIANVANLLEKEKPFLKEIIRFYEKVFSLQHGTDPDITKDYSDLKNKKEYPLINKKDFCVDFDDSEMLFVKFVIFVMILKLTQMLQQKF